MVRVFSVPVMLLYAMFMNMPRGQWMEITPMEYEDRVSIKLLTTRGSFSKGSIIIHKKISGDTTKRAEPEKARVCSVRGKMGSL